MTSIRLAEEQPPPLIVLDVTPPSDDPPAMDSGEICRCLREDGAMISILAFALSEERKKALLDSGADECIQTPFAVRDLLVRVRANTWHLEAPLPGERGSQNAVSLRKP